MTPSISSSFTLGPSWPRTPLVLLRYASDWVSIGDSSELCLLPCLAESPPRVVSSTVSELWSWPTVPALLSLSRLPTTPVPRGICGHFPLTHSPWLGHLSGGWFVELMLPLLQALKVLSASTLLIIASAFFNVLWLRKRVRTSAFGVSKMVFR